MSAYLGPVRTAIITFPFLALVLALPFLVVVIDGTVPLAGGVQS